MEIKGIVTSGKGEGAYFMSLPIYKTQFVDKLDFIPFPGTLNLKIGDDEINAIHSIREDKMEIIKGEGKFGDVLLIKAVINDTINGAIIFPKKTTHGESILEFIASKNLKENLGIKNGDFVKITLNY